MAEEFYTGTRLGVGECSNRPGSGYHDVLTVDILDHYFPEGKPDPALFQGAHYPDAYIINIVGGVTPQTIDLFKEKLREGLEEGQGNPVILRTGINYLDNPNYPHSVAIIIDKEKHTALYVDPYAIPKSDFLNDALKQELPGYNIDYSHIHYQYDATSCVPFSINAIVQFVQNGNLPAVDGIDIEAIRKSHTSILFGADTKREAAYLQIENAAAELAGFAKDKFELDDRNTDETKNTLAMWLKGLYDYTLKRKFFLSFITRHDFAKQVIDNVPESSSPSDLFGPIKKQIRLLSGNKEPFYLSVIYQQQMNQVPPDTSHSVDSSTVTDSTSSKDLLWAGLAGAAAVGAGALAVKSNKDSQSEQNTGETNDNTEGRKKGRLGFYITAGISVILGGLSIGFAANKASKGDFFKNIKTFLHLH